MVAGRWLPGTVTAKEQSGYRVIYMGCESGRHHLSPNPNPNPNPNLI